jgi:hypothetical protein
LQQGDPAAIPVGPHPESLKPEHQDEAHEGKARAVSPAKLPIAEVLSLSGIPPGEIGGQTNAPDRGERHYQQLARSVAVGDCIRNPGNEDESQAPRDVHH